MSLLTTLPAAPSRFSTPQEFEDAWDAYLTAQSNMVSEINAGLGATVYALTATQASSSVTLANITGLVAPLEANSTYRVEAYVSFRSAATTTGAAIGFVAPSGSNPMLGIDVPINTTGSFLSKVFPNAAELTSGSVLGTGVTATGSHHTARVTGIVTTTTSGDFALQFATEVAASAITLQIGSTMTVTRLA